MLKDFALISVLLFFAQVVRARSKWAGRFLIPSSVIAGILGLIGGPQLFDILPFTRVENGAAGLQLQIGQYPAVLIVLVFAALLMGHRTINIKPWESLAAVRATLFYNLGAEFGQYGLAILFGMSCLAVLYPGLPPQFAVMLPSGFAGGHGTATVFGQAFKSDGWEEALSVGYAFATIGLIAAVLGGMLLINIAIRCGWTQFVRVPEDMPARERRTFLSVNDQFSMGTATVNPMALDPLAWHVAVLGSVYGITLGIDALTHRIFPGSYWLPQFAIAMLVGGLLQIILNRAHVGQFIDRSMMRHLSSLCADYLVAFGVASIKLTVVWAYIGPIAVMSIFGVVYSVAILFLGPWVFRDYWFERALFTYGWLTGVVGFSVALLRIVDPQMRTHTVEDYGTSFWVIGPAEMILYPLVIWACASGAYLAIGIILTLLAAALLFATRCSAPVIEAITIDPTLSPKAIRDPSV
jgi:ESS family glutamate:Na+ symporter